jgi:RNA polymerase sigma factor (sigma-70 family)
VTDEDEFTALFRAHYARVLAFVARRSDPARAHDVVAETFTTAWRHFGRLPDDPLPWLYRVARNSLANEERAARRQLRLADRIAQRRIEHTPDHALSVIADTGLRQALGRLSAADREALLLIGWEELDIAAAALVLGCSAVAFKVRVHRARRRLARLLETADQEHGPQPTPPGRRVIAAHSTTEVKGASA